MAFMTMSDDVGVNNKKFIYIPICNNHKNRRLIVNDFKFFFVFLCTVFNVTSSCGH